MRQLAVLGLPGKMVRETIARIIPQLLPCDLVAFQHLDDSGNLADAWINFPEMLPALGVYLEYFHNAMEAEAHVTFDEFFRSTAAADRMHRNTGNYLESSLYNELYKSINFRYIMRTAFRDGEAARGCLMLSRGHGTKDFSDEEMRLSVSLAPYLTHALSAPAQSAEDCDTLETAEGLLICNGNGAIEFSSPQGRALLHDIAETSMTAATLSDRCQSWAFPQLRRLIGEARLLAGGKAASVPVIVKNNTRGKYVLRVWQMNSAAKTGAPDLYSVSIRRYIPVALRLLENPLVVAMPGREKQICLLLAEGLETKKIAQRTGLTPNTAISYIRALYQRLGINSRRDLVSRLVDPVGSMGAEPRGGSTE